MPDLSNKNEFLGEKVSIDLTSFERKLLTKCEALCERLWMESALQLFLSNDPLTLRNVEAIS